MIPAAFKNWRITLPVVGLVLVAAAGILGEFLSQRSPHNANTEAPAMRPQTSALPSEEAKASHRSTVHKNEKSSGAHSLDLTPEIVARDFDSLSGRAEQGDRDAIVAIHDAVQGCGSVPTDVSARTRELELLEQGLKATGNEAAFAKIRDDQTLRYRRCDLFTSAQKASDMHWLKLGVQNGVQDLVGPYYWTGVSSDSTKTLEGAAEREAFADDAARLLSDAANDGSLEAMRSLSDAYARGTLNEAVDPIKAYGYLAAYMSLQPEQQGPDADATTQLLERVSKGLSDSQIAEGQDFANSLLNYCCR